jgi:hypothetical protein
MIRVVTRPQYRELRQRAKDQPCSARAPTGLRANIETMPQSGAIRFLVKRMEGSSELGCTKNG